MGFPENNRRLSVWLYFQTRKLLLHRRKFIGSMQQLTLRLLIVNSNLFLPKEREISLDLGGFLGG